MLQECFFERGISLSTHLRFKIAEAGTWKLRTVGRTLDARTGPTRLVPSEYKSKWRPL